MKQRLYALKNYTESGDLKAPSLFFYILLFLSRTWMLLLISIVSQQTGQKLLFLFYPEKIHFYYGLALGALPLIVFLISGRRFVKDGWAMRYWPMCFYLILISVLGDLILQLYYLYLTHFSYSVTSSIQLVITMWSLMFILKSQQLKDVFKANNKPAM